MSQHTLFRITRHPLQSQALEVVKSLLGDDVLVLEEDVPYGDSPVQNIKSALEAAGNPVFVEISAPLPILMQVIGNRQFDGVKFLRPTFRKENGRNVVIDKDANDRDVFEITGYEVLRKVEIIAEPFKLE